MTLEPPTSSDTSEPGDDGHDPVVARLLAPLREAAPPDLWASAVRLAPSDGGDLDLHRQRRHRRSAPVRAVALAAVVVMLAGTGMLLEQSRRDEGQRIESPVAGFPPGVEAGPLLGLDDDAPVGAFAVLYPAGLVVVEADGDVVGHYIDQAPGIVYDPARGTVGRLIGAPEGCVWDGPGSDDAVLFCHDANGPTIRGPSDGTPQTLASFPAPTQGQAPMPGAITAAYPAEGTRTDGGAALLQVQADCPGQQAFLVDDLRADGANGRGGTIRRLDGAGTGVTEPMAGLSRGLGWNRDGTEAYVWRTNGPCAPPLDQPGIYAYRLDGSSRLLVPTSADAVDVQLITGETPTYGDGAVTALPPPSSTSTTTSPPAATTAPAIAVDPLADRPEGWAGWAGPLRPQRADDPALADDQRRAMTFARDELGMVDPEVLATATVDPGPDWILTESGLSVRINPYAATYSSTSPATVPDPWQQVSAITFWPDGIYSLSVKVDGDTGRWQATIDAPDHGVQTSAAYRLGDSGPLDPTGLLPDGFGNVRFTFDLPGEPTEVAVLTIRWTDPATDELVGYQRTILPPGRFAAG